MNLARCMAALYLIEILHQTTTPALASMPLCRCILLKFYIKPQLRLERELAYCVVSYRNSTSNHNYNRAAVKNGRVVSYRNSTSNHNNRSSHNIGQLVVSYRNSTSNHNGRVCNAARDSLYLIEILHQTTTTACTMKLDRLLYLIEILHQTTTILLFLCPEFRLYLIEILHQTTTRMSVVRLQALLYLIEILHQTTTVESCVVSV